jgi:hypothetical protein
VRAPSPPAPSPRTPPVQAAPAPFKRLDILPEEALRWQLREVPEVALDQGLETSRLLFAAAAASRGSSYPGPAAVLGSRPALSGLPFLRAGSCRLSEEAAEDLGTLSEALHGHLRTCTAGDGPDARTDTDRLRQLLAEERAGRAQWRGPEAVPTLVQVLQAEDTRVRLLLVDLLGDRDDPRTMEALVGRALFDVSAEERQAAVRALTRRPPRAYRGLLLAGFRHPWPPAAAHAAEAFVALGDKGAVPRLEELADEPAPGLPAPVAGRAGPVAVREMVRVNHLANCLLCHPPSLDRKDPVRGVIPVPGRSPGPRVYYQGDAADLFVRADLTFLRQDFSLPQPVADPPKAWPAAQRFDYLVRVRPPTAADWWRARDGAERLTRGYQTAVRFALRELTGEGADKPGRDSGTPQRPVHPVAPSQPPGPAVAAASGGVAG